MSSRMMKRLLQQRAPEFQEAAANGRAEEEQEGEEEEEEGVVVSSRAQNLFDLLGMDDQEQDEESDGEEQEALEESEGKDAEAKEEESKSSKQKKKKKNKKKGAVTVEAEASAVDSDCCEAKGTGAKKTRGKEGSRAAAETAGGRAKGKGRKQRNDVEEVDEIAKALRELELREGGSAATQSSSKTTMSESQKNKGTNRTDQSCNSSGAQVGSYPLAVEVRFLRAEEELKRIFGARVMSSVDKQEERRRAAGAQSFGGGAGGRRGGGGGGGSSRRGAGFLRKTLLVQAKDYWPPAEGLGFSMEFVGSDERGDQRFRYVASAEYEGRQRLFDAAMESHDPNMLANMVARHPYHVEGLLALAEVYKHTGEFHAAAELLERCLFALECAWHPWFNAASGRCRLDYSWEPNRPLFHCLFRHIQHLTRRGCHRTAFEFSKLLLSLDPSNDPLGVQFCIDYFALRAGCYGWIPQFLNSINADKSLSLFPNFSFSVPLARFHEEEQGGSELEGKGAGSCKKSGQHEGEGGKGNGRETVGATEEESASFELLCDALMLHPYVLRQIVDKAPIKVDSAWAAVLKHWLFVNVTPGSASLDHVVSLYVERSFVLWRVPEVQAWLLGAAKRVAEKAGGKRNPVGDDDVATWECVRKEAFPPSEKNEYRHLLLPDFSDSVATLRQEDLQALQEANVEGGMPRVELMFGGGPRPADGARRREAPVDLDGQNPLMVFLQALLPWNDLGDENVRPPNEEEEG